MPLTGKALFERGDENKASLGYRSEYKNELASPGFYGVDLIDDSINVKIAASKRAAIHKYTFSENDSEDRKLIIDLQHRDDANVRESYIKVISPNELVGYRNTDNWARDQVVYFYLKFDKDILSTDYKYKNNSELKAALSFGSNIDSLRVEVGISAVDTDGAMKNAKAEVSSLSLEELKKQTEALWSKSLISTILKVKRAKRQFSTQLFTTACFAPNIFQDVDGRYRGMDKKIHAGSLDKPYFTIYSLWDTYRALHPLFNIIEPSFNGKLIDSLLTKYEQYGRMPEWELENFDTRIMIGYHGTSVIADAYAKGVRNFNQKTALEAMLNAANEDKKELNDFKNLGYVAHDYKSRGYRESASMTLEYAYDDWTIAKFAKDLALNKDSTLNSFDLAAISSEYKLRSSNYKSIFDQETGFLDQDLKTVSL